MKYREVIEAQAKVLIDLMKEGKPFLPVLKPGHPSTINGMPYNPITGRAYRGGNRVLLYLEGLAKGYSDNRWMTYRAAASIGAQVRKGEKSVALRALIYPEHKQDKGAEADPERGRAKTIPFWVFNAEQIDGLPSPPQRPETTPAQRMEKCEALLSASGARIVYGSNQPYYSPGTDTIHLPDFERFVSTDAAYAVAMHELGHWTGHSSRLDRDLSGRFGSESYAKEEVIVETASHIIGVELGIGHDPSQHAAYIKHWLTIARQDPSFLYTAAGAAEKICDFVGLERFVHEPMVKEQKQEVRTLNLDLPAMEDVAVGVSKAATRTPVRGSELPL